MSCVKPELLVGLALVDQQIEPVEQLLRLCRLDHLCGRVRDQRFETIVLVMEFWMIDRVRLTFLFIPLRANGIFSPHPQLHCATSQIYSAGAETQAL